MKKFNHIKFSIAKEDKTFYICKQKYGVFDEQKVKKPYILKGYSPNFASDKHIFLKLERFNRF